MMINGQFDGGTTSSLESGSCFLSSDPGNFGAQSSYCYAPPNDTLYNGPYGASRGGGGGGGCVAGERAQRRLNVN